MKSLIAACFAGFLLNIIASTASAENPANADLSSDTIIDIAGHPVPVVTGGLYDLYRSNPPLSVIQSERPNLDLSWFEGMEKTKLDIGFESYSPNFYYENSRISAIFTADLDKLKALMPEEVLSSVKPLQIWPNRGLVVITGYVYEYCDNDTYKEVSLAIVTNKPDGTKLSLASLAGQSLSDDYWGYVLKLPVNTELARVRGVVGYNLPKWLTDINYSESNDAVTFEVIDQETGKVDIAFSGAKLGDLSQKPQLVTNNFTNIDQDGKLTHGYAVSKQLSQGGQ